MLESTYIPAQAGRWLSQWQILFLTIHALGIACFGYIVAKRMVPLLRAERDFRFDQPLVRLGRVLQFWLGQWKHPRYRTAGVIHIVIFAGFIVLGCRAFSLLFFRISGDFLMPGFSGTAGHVYDVITDYAATIYHLLGIDYEKALVAGTRPVKIVKDGEVAKGLLA